MLDDKVQETIVSTPPNREAVQAPKSKSPGKKAPIKRQSSMNIPGPFRAVMEVWYGSDQQWDRHTLETKGIGKKWFRNDPEFDKMLTERFKKDVEELQKGNREELREDHYGRLVYCLLGDQFARNIFRGKPEAFACAPRTESLVREILSDRDVYDQYRNYEKTFLLMVMMHSEN